MVMAAQEAKEVQERQLQFCQSTFILRVWSHREKHSYGLPSFPSTTPLGIVFLGGVSASFASPDSVAGFFCCFWTSVKNLSMPRLLL